MQSNIYGAFLPEILVPKILQICWNQRILCCANDRPLELDTDDIAGLYWTFESVLEDIAEALKMLEKSVA